MCHTDQAGSEKLGEATGKASAKFLEAASQAFLLFKAIEGRSDSFESHSTNVKKLLEGVIGDYEEALKSTDDLKQADQFLKARPFDRLHRMLGITPGTLNHTRWQIITKTVKESQAPTADLIRVCVSGAASLKYAVSDVKIGMPPSQLRRALYAWSLVLSHGALISDAFDSSLR